MTASKKPAPKAPKVPAVKDITVRLATMGSEPAKKSCKAGTTLAEFKARFSIVEGIKVTVNGHSQGDSYTLADNDSVVAVPQVKGGR